MALTKVQQATLYAIASTATATADHGAAVDVSTYYGIDVRIRVGRTSGTAFTTAPIIRLEGTYDSSSPTNQQWVSLAEFQPAIGASIGAQTTSSGDGPGSTAVTLAAATNFAAGDYVFFNHTTIANSEWHRVEAIAGAVITIEEALIADQAAATVYDQAEQYHVLADCTSLQGVRLVVNNSGGAVAVIVAAELAAVSGM